MKMRETIARALVVGEIWSSWEDMPPVVREGWLDYADAVLDAMREPDAAMVKASQTWASECGCQFEPIAIGYQRMIDAAKAGQ